MKTKTKTKTSSRRILSALLVFVMILTLLPTVALAEENVAIDDTNFPDPVFRTYVVTKYDKDEDGFLSVEEIAAGTSIFVRNKEIASLKGVEYFTALESLNCYNNQLTSLDVSNNTKLTRLDCANNQLTSLDVSNNTALTDLDCVNNQLTSLDVRKTRH